MNNLLIITNREELQDWMELRRISGTDIHSVKGPVPVGATYDGYLLIEGSVNIAWKDSETGELCHIEYAPIE